jgi:hypothetical protein
VTGSDFFAGNMTIANDYSKTSDVPSQAVALSVRADQAVLRHVRLLGAQDTLYASSMGCMKDGSECRTGNVRALDSSDDSDDSIHPLASWHGTSLKKNLSRMKGYVDEQSQERKTHDRAYIAEKFSRV